MTYGKPILGYTDTNGQLTLNGVVPGLYRLSISPPNANNPAIRNNLMNFANMVNDVSIIETNGGTVNINTCLVVITS